MSAYIKPLEIRWSDLDPNFHLRHSVYYDFGAYARISFFERAWFNPIIYAETSIWPYYFQRGMCDLNGK